MRKAVQLAAGMGATCARMDDGSVRCWGRNDYGELRNASTSPIDAATPVAVAGVAGSSWLGMGGDPGDQGDLVCSIDGNADVTCWGYTRLLPVEGASPGAPTPVPALHGAKEIAFGGGTLYAVMADGSVLGWGNTTFNALGDGDTSGNDKGPTKIPGVSGAVHVAGGRELRLRRGRGRQGLVLGLRRHATVAKEACAFGATAIARPPAVRHLRRRWSRRGAVLDEDMVVAALPAWAMRVNARGPLHRACRGGGALSLGLGRNDRGQLGLGKPGDGAAEPTPVTASRCGARCLGGFALHLRRARGRPRELSATTSVASSATAR
ncbi:MAG: RCC1 domain-containing protein [Nannocystaceae bacterium]